MDGETRVLISHMAPARKHKIKQSLRNIAQDPSAGKTLQENLAGLQSYRVGPLRIIYSVDRLKKTVHVIAIGPRRTIYEELERLLAKRSP
jgi:mRNA-degrading endonuclease RelE of RelBE toxin-antitoxin system